MPVSLCLPSYRTLKRNFIYTPYNGRLYDLRYERDTGHRHVYLQGKDPHTLSYKLINWPAYNYPYAPIAIDLNYERLLYKYPALVYDVIYVLTHRERPPSIPLFAPGSKLFDIYMLRTDKKVSSTPTYNQLFWYTRKHPFIRWDPLTQRWCVEHTLNGHKLRKRYQPWDLIHALVALREFRAEHVRPSKDPYFEQLDYAHLKPRNTVRLPFIPGKNREETLQEAFYAAALDSAKHINHEDLFFESLVD